MRRITISIYDDTTDEDATTCHDTSIYDISDDDLPGMWSRSDFEGGQDVPEKQSHRCEDAGDKGRIIKVADNRNKRSVWHVASSPFKQAHFATFPPDLIRPCILAGCPEGGTVLDPFLGSGTTAQVARSIGRKAIGFELNEAYIKMAIKHRLAQGVLL